MDHFEFMISRGNASIETVDGQPTDVVQSRLTELASNPDAIYFQEVPLTDRDYLHDALHLYELDRRGGSRHVSPRHTMQAQMYHGKGTI